MALVLIIGATYIKAEDVNMTIELTYYDEFGNILGIENFTSTIPMEELIDNTTNTTENITDEVIIPEPKEYTLTTLVFDGATTDFTIVDKTKAIEDVVIEKRRAGKIIYSVPIEPTKNLNLDQMIDIRQNKIEVNSALAPELNKPAILILYNLSFISPRVMKNSEPCMDCNIISYTNGTLEFYVNSFSTYSAEETIVTVQDAPTSGGGGGGGWIQETIKTTPKINTSQNVTTLITPKNNYSSNLIVIALIIIGIITVFGKSKKRYY